MDMTDDNRRVSEANAKEQRRQQSNISRLDALADALFVQDISSWIDPALGSRRCYEYAAQHIAEGDKFRAEQKEDSDEQDR